MSRTVRISFGTWCTAFGLRRPATLEQTLEVISAFGYDGVELAGFLGHATIRRYPDAAARRRLAAELDRLGLHPLVLAPAPEPDEPVAQLPPWALSDDPVVVSAHRRWWADYLEMAVELGIQRVRIEPGARGPLPYGVDHRRVWARVVEMFQWLGEQGAAVGCTMLWEMESNQPFNKPDEIVRLLSDVDHPHCRLLYDTAHFHAAAVVGHNQVQPTEVLDGGQVELIRRLKGRIGHVHLCDTDGNVARNYFARKLGFGKGVVDFAELLPVLADCYDGEWWGVDVIPMTPEVWGDAWEGLAFVREVVAGHVS